MDERIKIRKRPVIKITRRKEVTEPRIKITRRDSEPPEPESNPTKNCEECGRPRPPQ